MTFSVKLKHCSSDPAPSKEGSQCDSQLITVQAWSTPYRAAYALNTYRSTQRRQIPHSRNRREMINSLTTIPVRDY